MNKSEWLPALAVAGCILLFAGAAAAQHCLYADFDNDGDPWTLRTYTMGDYETIRLVFEAPADLPLGEEFFISVAEGCCDDYLLHGHYGARFDWDTVTFDPAFVDSFVLEIHTCLYCCPQQIIGRFSATAPMVPGERYFIGEFDAYSICEPVPLPPCDPPHDIGIGFDMCSSDACEQSSVSMDFYCPGNPVEEGSWGTIKALYH
jgi:hypothetical protein